MSIVKSLHSHLVFPKRVTVLAKLVGNLIPDNYTVLDVGCGDGLIDRHIMENRPDLKITGTDVLKREETHIPVTVFDGKKLPFPDKSFDCVIFIDTLHHTDDPTSIMAEAKRVAKRNIIIKDHYAENRFSFTVLKFMDWVGNKFHGVVLPYNYLSSTLWGEVYNGLGLRKEKEINRMDLYPFPFNFVFEKGLQFIVKLSL